MVEYEEDYFTKSPYSPYIDWGFNKVRAQKIIDLTHPYSVLDVGCAYGYIVKRFLDMGIPAIGMDISHWCESRNIIPEHFVRHDLRDTPYPFEDKQFSVLYCEGVLEHIEEEHIPKIMREFERVALRRILQISLINHDGSKETPGHICLKDHDWWFDRMPDHTWLFISPTGTQDGKVWLYKG